MRCLSPTSPFLNSIYISATRRHSLVKITVPHTYCTCSSSCLEIDRAEGRCSLLAACYLENVRRGNFPENHWEFRTPPFNVPRTCICTRFWVQEKTRCMPVEEKANPHWTGSCWFVWNGGKYLQLRRVYWLCLIILAVRTLPLNSVTRVKWRTRA